MRNLRLALFVVLVVGAGFATGFCEPAWRLVRRARQAVVQPAELDLRPGLVDRLPAGGDRGLANLGA